MRSVLVSSIELLMIDVKMGQRCLNTGPAVNIDIGLELGSLIEGSRVGKRG